MKDTIIQLLKNFYSNCHRMHRSGDVQSMRRLYERVCLDLENLIPVHRNVASGVEDILKNREERLLVVANHIPTPNLFALDDKSYIKSIGIDPEDLHLNVIHPLPVRHYPMVNYFGTFGINTHIVSRSEPQPLSSFYHGWGNITIPEKGPDRINVIYDEVLTLNHTPWALIMFPEGADSHDDLYAGTSQLLPLKKGFAVLANRYSLPILPISLRFDPIRFLYTMTVHPLLFRSENISEIIMHTEKYLSQP